MQRIRSHYQNKLNTLRRILELYQGKVEKKNADWERRVAVSCGCSLCRCLLLSKYLAYSPATSAASQTLQTLFHVVAHVADHRVETLNSFMYLFMYCISALASSCFLQAVTAQNEQLQEEQRAERRRSKEEALQWHREKVGYRSGRLLLNWSTPCGHISV